MKVVHVPFGYYPDAVGGTEVYVAELARALVARGVESVVAAAASGHSPVSYVHDGVPVHRFALPSDATAVQVHGAGDPGAARAIGDLLENERADVLHLHALTRGASLLAAREARRRGVAVVFTYHTPTVSCMRGTLLFNGAEPCDGTLDAQRCAACLLESRGAGPLVRETLSRVPLPLATVGGALGAGRVATALGMRELTASRHATLRDLLHTADAIVAVCEWVRTVLLRAGAPPSRLMLSRQGTPGRPVAPATSREGSGALRLAFVGRLHPTKGLHVLLEAMRRAPTLPLTLDVFGGAQGDDGAAYEQVIRADARDDPRVRVRGAIGADRVVETLAAYDATVVPSQWLETGPLTVLESFAAGVPVIGSNLGGIAELVRHDRDGWLVPYGDVDAWTATVHRLTSDPSLITRLRGGVRRPRSTDDVARDMVSVYDAVAPRRRPRGAAIPAGIA